jgi:uncharacterized RDD family membrane protein YckC
MDLPLVVVWVLFTAAVGALLRAVDATPATPEGWDLYAFLTLVSPVLLSFAALESGAARATPGKRRLGLAVGDRDGARISRGRALVRGLVKFAPWQMAHTAVFQMTAGRSSVALWALSIAAQALVLVSAGLVVFGGGRALHDRVAGTWVRDREEGSRAGAMK